MWCISFLPHCSEPHHMSCRMWREPGVHSASFTRNMKRENHTKRIELVRKEGIGSSSTNSNVFLDATYSCMSLGGAFTSVTYIWIFYIFRRSLHSIIRRTQIGKAITGIQSYDLRYPLTLDQPWFMVFVMLILISCALLCLGTP